MVELTVGPWRRPGKDRLYVNRPGAKGESVAWLDCQTGVVTITDREYGAAALAKIEEWCRTCGRTIPPRTVKPNSRHDAAAGPPATAIVATTNTQPARPASADLRGRPRPEPPGCRPCSR